MCAGLAAATGLYSICGLNSTLIAAGVPVSASRENATDDEARATVDPGTHAAENERIQRALFEADQTAKPAVQRVAGWPLKKKPAPPTSTKPSLSRLRRSNQARDPFAEADKEEQAEILAGTRSDAAALAPDSGFTKSTSNRRRLLEFQGEKSLANDSDKADVAGKVSVTDAAVEKSKPAARALSTVVKPSIDKPASEAEMRSLFEEEPVARESATRSTARTATQAPVTAKENIQQVSEADSTLNSTAVPASQDTPIPSEALKYRAQKAQQRGQIEMARQLEVAADKDESTATLPVPAPIEPGEPRPAQAQVEPDSDPFAEPPAAAPLPAPLPEMDTDLPAKARVDVAPVESDAKAISRRAKPSRPEPAMIPQSEEGAASEPDDAGEPVIRSANQATLPPVQVLANRGIELPAPEGWSAAVKLNARRAARLAALTGRQPDGTVWPQIKPSKSSTVRQPHNHSTDSSAYQGQTQSYRTSAVQQPVALDQIEDDGTVRVLNAEASDLGELRDAYHQEESEAVIQEPAKIPDTAAEPVVIAAYAAHGYSVWWLRLITAVSVLLGLYGMWCCRIRATDSE